MKSLYKIKFLVNRFLEVQSSDPDDARQRRILNIILTLVGSLGLVSSILAWALVASGIMPRQEISDILIASFAMFIGSVLTFIVNRYGSGLIAGTMFILLVMFATFFSDTPYELSNGRSVYLFVLPIVISSFLLGSRSTFVFYILSSIELGIVAVLAGGPVYTPVFAYIAFFIVAFISWLASRSLEQALKELRTTNLNLDNLVEQKTQELATTLMRELILSGRNQAILNSIADGVIVFDENNTAILANPALSQLTETPIHDLINKHVNDFTQNKSLPPVAQGMLLELLDNPQKSATGMRINWGTKTLSTSIARVRDAGNKYIGTVAVFRDVTREVELEKMKDTFMGIVSHELRTPLNAILGYAEMFKEGIYGPISEKQQGISTRIMTNTERLLAIVSDLLDQAQIQSGKLKIQMNRCMPVELLDGVHGVMDRIAIEKGIDFITELDPAIPTVLMGDLQRLQQITVNLASNAIKFTEKGSVCVKISLLDKNNWQIQTIDTGNGIPKEALAYIFESFRQVDDANTRQHGGVGLGLSIVKQLAELMKGKVIVESEIGKGSIFTVNLPLILPELSQTKPLPRSIHE
jgi:PAS domain S-box-containing protein